MDVEDLFTGLPAEKEAPVAAPAEEMPAEEAAAPATDDLFAPAAAPAAEPAAEEKTEPAGDAFDDLFKAPAKPAAEEPAEAKPAASDDPFGTVQVKLPVRTWKDDTGAYEVTARLVVIMDGKVRLLKETGRTTTVPLDRLSQADRQYVDQMVAQYGKDAFSRVASK